MSVRAWSRLVALAAVVMAAASASVREDPTVAGSKPQLSAFRTTTLTARGRQLIAHRNWSSDAYVTSTGESVRLSMSPAYASDPGAGQRWAEFLASLIHGPELALLEGYIAPLDEVETLCGEDSFGCYGGNHMVAMGETNFGVRPESVVAHEYGHHVAAHRTNDPWPAVDWGTKRWATYVGVCSRVGRGNAYPGDEGFHYELNPGEAFAEAYRVLIETHGSAAGYDWDLVDPGFRPDEKALARIREDVVDPWTQPASRTIHGRFLHRSRTWTTRVSTPLDGDLRLTLTVPGGGTDDVTLLSADGRTVLARGAWTTSGGKSLEYRVCGERSVRVRITRDARPARFSLRVTTP